MNRLICATLLGGILIVLLGAAPTSEPADDAFSRQVKFAEQELDRAQAIRDKTRSEVQAMRDELRKMTSRADTSPEGIRRAITRLQEQQEELQLDQAGSEGRRKGLIEAINQMTAQIQEKGEKYEADSAAVELKRVVALREEELKREQELAKEHAVSQQQLTEAQVAVADARLKLLDVRRQAVGSANAESLDTWNRELMNLTISQQEREARLRFIGERLNELTGVLPRLDEMERLLSDVHSAEANVQQAQLQLNQVRTRGELFYKNPVPSTP